MKIRVKDRIVFETFRHYLMEVDLDEFVFTDNELKNERITKDNASAVGSAVGRTTGKWIAEDYPYAEGYCFRNQDNEIVGSCWMMHKGGKEKLYKVRDCDAFMFRLEVNEAYRGQGYAKKILNNIYQIEKDKGNRLIRFVTATRNDIAIHLYESIGAKKIGKRYFVRILDRNIPYYSV